MLLAWTMAGGLDLHAFMCALVSRRFDFIGVDMGRVYSCFGHILAVGWFDGLEVGGVIPADTDMMGFVQFLDDISWIDSDIEGAPWGNTVVALFDGCECELRYEDKRAHPGSDSYHNCGDGYVTEDGYPFDERITKWRPI
jgi:hypothetical protein